MRAWRILLDIDGTIAYNAGKRLAAAYFGVRIEDTQTYQPLQQLVGLTDGQFWEWWSANEEEIYRQADPIPHAPECVRALKQAGSFIAVVTARRRTAASVTEQWLDAHGFPYDELICEADDKVAVARALQLELAFEDDTIHAIALAEWMPVIAVEGPKNRLVPNDHPRIFKVQDWAEIAPLLQSLSLRLFQ